MKHSFVSIIVVNYNGKKYLKSCFNSLYKLNYPKNKLEIIMVDNRSSDGSVNYIKKNFPKIKIVKNDINNYTRANNLGIRYAQAKSKYIALLNNDTRVDQDWLIELVRVIERKKDIGLVGSKILLMNGRIDNAGHQQLPNFYWLDRGFSQKDSGQYDQLKQADSISGCANLYRRRALKEVGYFDEDFNMYLEDVDMSLRLRRQGWSIVYAPQSLVRHIHQGSTQKDSALFCTEKNRLLLVAKHFPDKLSNALLGRGYFTVQRDIESQASIYKILNEVVLKLTKHHSRNIVKKVLAELFEELKKITSYENSILVEKTRQLLESVDSSQEALKSKDTHIHSLNQEVAQRDQLIQSKDQHLNSLDNQIKSQDQALRQKDTHIHSLNQEITQGDQLIQSKDQHLHTLDNQLKTQDQALQDKDTHIHSLNQEISSIYNSTAFKFIVRPLWDVLWKIKQLFKRHSQDRLAAERAWRTNTGRIGICTIISKNYLSYARVLTESFLEYNQGEVFVLLTDKIDGYFDPKKEKFTLIEIEQIKHKIPDFDKFCFQYNITELNTAVKPFFLEFLFEKYQIQKLIFLDPDILITKSLDQLFRLMDQWSIVLIPHITRPFPDNRKPYELDILRSGVYNLGFIALASGKTTKLLLKWWKERLKRYCKVDFQEGLFVDQKWIDFLPGFFEDVFILRDESYNAAYWNFHYRKVYLQGSDILINGAPAHFLHFSGLNPQDLRTISRHQDRFRLKDLEQMRPVFELYKNKLIEHGYDYSKDWPYAFDYFDNRVKIPEIARKIFWKVNNNFNYPFNVAAQPSYFNWLNEKIDKKNPVITRLMYEIYLRRPDVKNAYPEIFGAHRKAFIDWFIKSGRQEHNLSKEFYQQMLLPPPSPYIEFPKISFKLIAYNKIRNILKLFLKKFLTNSPQFISRLKIMEMQLYASLTSGANNVATPQTNNNFAISKKNRGVNVFGYLNSELGVGEAARANVKCLKYAGVKHCLINIKSYSRQKDTSFSQFSKKNGYPINLIHINADMLPRLIIEKGSSYFKNKYNVGFWTWELSEFPDQWLSSFNYCNEIWVPSRFTRDSIAKKSPLPVFTVPHAIEIDNFKDVGRDYFGLKHDEFVFLFVFDFLSYFERKNPIAIVQAFKKAFSAKDKAKLVIKSCNSSFNPQALNRLKCAAAGLNIYIIDKYLDRDEVNTLISLCDCYVSLHRSEGFGLTIAEAMYLGKPVIATGYSGNCDFMNINNSYPVRYKLVEINEHVGPYKKGCLWAEPNIDHAAELMRYVYENRSLAQGMGMVAKEDIKNDLNYNVVGKTIKKRVEQIYID